MEIHKMQSNEAAAALCIPYSPFTKLAREIVLEHSQKDFWIQHDALLAIQMVTENFLTMLFEMANHVAIHAHHVTIQPKDIELVRELWGYIKPGDPIAKLMDEMIDSINLAKKRIEELKKKQHRRPWQKHQELEARGEWIPNSLTHYLNGVEEVGGEYLPASYFGPWPTYTGACGPGGSKKRKM